MRIRPSLIQQARRISPQILKLLRPCKTIKQAERELRWIQAELPRSQWNEAIDKRSRLVPLQYILGSQPFGSLDIKCKENVLIPRWETEEWCLKLADVIRKQSIGSVLDVCTGSGCIPLLLASEIPKLRVDAVDISPNALELSEDNKILNGVTNVNFRFHDVFTPIESRYDIITSNPPYIPAEDYLQMEKSVRLYEPSLALIGNLEFYKALVKNVVIPSEANAFVFELGYLEQYEYTKSLLPDEWDCYLYQDSANKPRCVVGYREPLKVDI